MGLRLQFFQDCRGWSRPSSPSKLNTVEHVDRLDWMMEQLHGAGFSRLNATQLFHNRQELFVHAQR